MRRTSRVLIVIMLTWSATPLCAAPALAQAKGESVERRVTFPRGRTSATVKGYIPDRLTTHLWMVRAKAGQTMRVRLATARRDVDMCVVYPNGSTPDGGCGRGFTGVLPEDGDYSIIVDSKRDKTSYTVTVSIR